MKLANLFYKPISRNINGVIKVGQQDDGGLDLGLLRFG